MAAKKPVKKAKPAKKAAKKAVKKPVKKAVKKAPVKKTKKVVKKVATKKVVKKIAKKVVVKKAPKKVQPKKVAPKKAAVKTAEKKPSKSAPVKAEPIKAKPEPVKKAVPPPPPPPPPPPKPLKPLPAEFLSEMKEILLAERAEYENQLAVITAEAQQLAAEHEPGDVDFSEEGGEGDALAMERERDLTLSSQARASLEEIDHALNKVTKKTYGYCENCRNPIPKARLKALPFAELCVDCKQGGLSRRL